MTKKQLGQIFTPDWIVEMMLDKLGYIQKNILKKHILEPSFGNGAFLTKIVDRYISIALKEGLKEEEIKKDLETYIHGYEIDTHHFKDCIKKLNKICALYGIDHVSWKLLNTDTLTMQIESKMDYVTGNPPYVKIHNTQEDIRNILKSKFNFCQKGNTDMYLAFFELSLDALNSNGKLCFITPNTFMYNTSFKRFRNYISINNLVVEILDFESTKVFNATTYNAITLMQKNKKEPFTKYSTFKQNIENYIGSFHLLDFEDTWNFQLKHVESEYTQFTNGRTKIQDAYTIQYALTTMRDKVFISKCREEKGACILFNNHYIEKEITRPIVKISTYKGDEQGLRAIFPYKKHLDKYVPLTEEELKLNYPKTYQYLLLHKEELTKRDIKNGTNWYEYGRTQALQNMSKEKLIIKSMINNTKTPIIEAFLIPEKTLAFAGIIATGTDLERLQRLFKNRTFVKYILLKSKDLQGGFKVFRTGDLKNSYLN